MSPTKRTSDHSISQLISSASSNHSVSGVSMKLQTQSTSYGNPTFSKNMQPIGTSSRMKNERNLAPSNGSKNDETHNKEHKTKTAQTPIGSSIANNNYKMPIIDLSSDDTEFSHSPPKKSKSHKHKHSKKNKDVNNIGSIVNASAIDMKTNEIDHNQIIHDLKVNNQLFGRHFDVQL